MLISFSKDAFLVFSASFSSFSLSHLSFSSVVVFEGGRTGGDKRCASSVALGLCKRWESEKRYFNFSLFLFVIKDVNTFLNAPFPWYFFGLLICIFSHKYIFRFRISFSFWVSSSALHLSLFPFSSSFRPLASLPSLLPRQDQSQISSRAGSYPSRFLRHLYPFFISFFYPINRHTSLHLSPFRLLPLSRRIGWRFCLRLLACNIFSYRVWGDLFIIYWRWSEDASQGRRGDS